MVPHSHLRGSGFLLALACAVIWAGQSVAVKVALRDVPAPWLISSRFLIGGAFAAAVLLISRRSLWFPRAAVRPLLLTNLLLFSQIALFTVGTGWTTSARSIVLINTFPFFTALFTFQRPLPRGGAFTMVGLPLAFLGVVLLFADERDLISGGSLAGDLLVLLSALVMAANITLTKDLLKSVEPLQVVFWEGAMALPVFSAFALLQGSPLPVSVSAETLLSVGYQGIVVSGLAFWVWLNLLKRYPAEQLNVIRLLTPLFGLLIGPALLLERLTPMVVTGALCTSLGIVLTVWGRSTHGPEDPEASAEAENVPTLGS